MQLKSHRNQWSKSESTQARIYKTCKTNHAIQQLPPLYISRINKPLSWNFGRNYERGQFVTLKTISSITSFSLFFFSFCERPHPRPHFLMLGQTHLNGWSRVIASQNGDSTSYIFPLRLGVLQWSRHLFNYWKNKKTIIEKFLILLI